MSEDQIKQWIELLTTWKKELKARELYLDGYQTEIEEAEQRYGKEVVQDIAMNPPQLSPRAQAALHALLEEDDQP